MAPTNDSPAGTHPKTGLYTPLDQGSKEIRLLRVAPYHGDDVLSVCECTMFKASLSQQPPPKYNAFSYEWASARDISYEYRFDNIVVVNGHRVPATKNLVALLTRYRNIAQTVPDWTATHAPIWIDALCIDQDNIEERNSQVALMGAIYSDAQATLSWLGESEDDSDYAVEMISNIGSKILMIPKGEDDLTWLDPENQPDLWHRSGYLNRFWTSAGALMKRTYWQRSWVVQEVMLQPNVIVFCGRSVCHYFQIEAIHRWLRRIQGRPCPSGVDEDLWQLLATKVGWYSMGWNNLQRRIKLDAFRETGDPAVDEKERHLQWKSWVTSTLFKQATDPRDKLYSVLGLVGIDSLRPDYSASVEEVFWDFATTNIRVEGSLDIFAYAGHWRPPPPSKTKDKSPVANLFVPSWVPNLDKVSKTYEFFWFLNPDHDASADWPSIHPVRDGQAPWSVDGNMLTTPGVPFDVISTTRICDLHDGSWLSFCLDYVNARSGEPYPSGIPPLQALAHLVLRGRDFTGQPMEPDSGADGLVRGVFPGFSMTLYSGDSRTPVEDMKKAQETLGISSPSGVIKNFVGTSQARSTAEKENANNTSKTSISRASFVPDSMNFRDQVGRGMGAHVAFVTAKGYIGWGRNGLQEGDRVCVLPTCRFPVLLRHVDQQHIHMGACFIVGLMQGEAMSHAKQGTVQVETFHIV